MGIKSNSIRFMIIAVLMVYTANHPVFALESMTTDQLKNTTAQSGVDIAIRDGIMENYLESFRLNNTDPGYTDQYIDFGGISIISTISTGSGDKNNDGMINHLSIDMGLNGTKPMLFVSSPDLNISTDLWVDSIDFYGTNIGSLFLDNILLSSFHLTLGAHDSCGMDFEIGQKISVDSLTYRYNSTSTGVIKLTGIHFAGVATNGAPEDPTKWDVRDEFIIGDLANNRPATIDVQADSQAVWNFSLYSVANPRYGSGFVALNLPMDGSIRMENLRFGSNDFGSVAIDGLHVEKLYIEIPGRGLGK